MVTSGETTCDPDGYCIRLRGSNLNTSQTYVGIREVNSAPGPHIFQAAGLTLGSDGNGQYLQVRVPVSMQSLFESQGLNFYGVNHGQLVLSVPVFLQKSVNSVVSLTITANPATNLIAPATTTLTSSLCSTIGVTVASYLVAGNSISCAGGVGPAPTYSCAWQNIAAGTYSVIARATANSQNYDSASLSVTVAAGTTPSVSVIANPANGLIAPASTTLSATLTNVTNVTAVSYFNGANQIACTVGAAPNYSCVWTGITEGSYSVTARATITGGSTVI